MSTSSLKLFTTKNDRPLFYQNNQGDIIKLTYTEKNGEYGIELEDTDLEKKEPHEGYIKYRMGKPSSSELELKTMLVSPQGAGTGTFLIDLLLAVAKGSEYKFVRTLNTNPEAFPFYRSLNFEPDEKSDPVTGTSKDRKGNELNEKGFTEWCVEVEKCKDVIAKKTKPSNAWAAIPSQYNQILSRLYNLGALNTVVKKTIKEDPSKILLALEKILDDLKIELKEVNDHLQKIGTGFTFRNTSTINQKRQVLSACKSYLESTINRSQLEDVVKKNPNYSAAIGTSQTKKLVEQVLNVPQKLQNKLLSSEFEIKPSQGKT